MKPPIGATYFVSFHYSSCLSYALLPLCPSLPLSLCFSPFLSSPSPRRLLPSIPHPLPASLFHTACMQGSSFSAQSSQTDKYLKKPCQFKNMTSRDLPAIPHPALDKNEWKYTSKLRVCTDGLFSYMRMGGKKWKLMNIYDSRIIHL